MMPESTVSETSVALDGGNLLLSAYSSHIEALEAQMTNTLDSQHQLEQHADALAEYVRELGDDSPEPYNVRAYVDKLQDCRRRLAKTSEIMNSLGERLGQLQRKIAREAYAKKTSIKEQTVPEKPVN